MNKPEFLHDIEFALHNAAVQSINDDREDNKPSFEDLGLDLDEARGERKRVFRNGRAVVKKFGKNDAQKASNSGRSKGKRKLDAIGQKRRLAKEGAGAKRKKLIKRTKTLKRKGK